MDDNYGDAGTDLLDALGRLAADRPEWVDDPRVNPDAWSHQISVSVGDTDDPLVAALRNIGKGRVALVTATQMPTGELAIAVNTPAPGWEPGPADAIAEPADDGLEEINLGTHRWPPATGSGTPTFVWEG